MHSEEAGVGVVTYTKV